MSHFAISRLYVSDCVILFERMEQFQLLCQIRQILAPVTLGASDAFMISHILNLPDIVSFEPVHYDP